MLTRWLIFVGLLLGADYGAWRWATSAASDIPALIAGLALALLAVAFVWLLVLATLDGLMRAGRGVNGRLRPRRLPPPVAGEGPESRSDPAAERVAA
jgi:hypothetical protein